MRSLYHPQLTPASERVLSAYYQLQRSQQADHLRGDAARSTVRLLESLIRLAQAHARLMCRNRVLIVDAIAAVMLMECSRMYGRSATLLDVPSSFHSSFPEDADVDYSGQRASP